MQKYLETNEKISKKGWGPAHLPIPNAMMLLILFTLLFALLLTVVTGIRVSRQRERVSILPEEKQPSDTGTDPTKQQPTEDQSPVFEGGNYISAPVRSATFQEIGTGIDSTYAALLNTETGEIVAGKDENTRFDPASMTKVMTLLVACEHLKQSDLDRRVTLTQDIYDIVHPTSQNNGYFGADSYFGNVYVGSEITMRTALYGIGVSSFADCTVMAILNIAESEEAFVEMMNAEVSAMGLTNTHFDNVIGYESDDNYTTATEMAAILARALQCDLIRKILSTPSYPQFEIYDGEQIWHGNFYSTLFNANGQKSSRFADAGIGLNKPMPLDTATFGGGKTGSLKPNDTWVYSLASFAVAKSDQTTRYVLITGNSTIKGGVITDAQTIYNQYIP